MADNDFPRALYKKSEVGNSQPVWGLGNFEVRSAADQAEVDAALADGWTLSPSDDPAAAKAAKSDPKPAASGDTPKA